MSALRQREPRYENRALLDACHEIPCQGGWTAECGNSMTEPAHSNQSRHGKGKSIKAHDCFIAGLCRSCHQEIDQGRLYSRQERFDLWQSAHEKTLLILFRRGLVRVATQWVTDLIPSKGPVTMPAPRRNKTGHQNGRSTARPGKIIPRAL